MPRLNGDRIRELRCSRGLTQREMGKMLNYTPTVICHWETLPRSVAPKIVKMLADFFKVPAKELIYRDESKKPRVGLTMDRDILLEARLIAKVRCISLSTLMERAVKEYLEKGTTDFEKQQLDFIGAKE